MHTNQTSLETLLAEAVEIVDEGLREAYLQRVCAGDSEQLAELRSMVHDYFAAGSLIDRPAAIMPTIDLPAPTAIGRQIGPYKLRELLGEGGMGSVYVAEQGKPIRRKVALKIIKPGMDSQEVIARFEAERQALALMEHPNIAKVFDAGTTELGRPYFIMELVKGLPITDHCDLHKLGNRDRLNLFLQVCHAVQHAHQKGIIHRDLKPSNVIVAMNDTIPVVKVIDFGVAKAIGQSLSDHSLYTNFNQMIGTPMYMSPEQAGQSSMDVDTRSDVYSLGVLLYEMITGSTPFAIETLKKVGFDEMRRIIREVEPPRPSVRISTLNAEALSTISDKRQLEPQRLSKQLRGELDWIVMKAIEKHRDRRYNSASAFADDIERYLDGREVEACPPSVAYRMSKFARRYRVPLTTATVLVLMMLFATVFSLRSSSLATQALQNESIALAKVVEKQTLLEKEKLESDSQRKIAEDERETAEQQRSIAEERRLKAEQLESEAVQQRETVRQNLYLSDMRLAAIDLSKGNLPRLHKKLQVHIPDVLSADMRRWEWFYLQASSRQEQRTLFGPIYQIEDVAWSPDGRHIASSGYDGVRIWDALTGLQVYEDHSSGTLNRGAAWSPDSHRLTWGSVHDENTIRIWDSRSNEVVKLDGHTFSIEAVCWSPDGRQLASSAMDGTCRIWDLEKRECVFVLECNDVHFPDVCWNSKQDLLATSCTSAKKGLVIWNPKTGEHVTDVLAGQKTEAVEFTLDGRQLIVGTNTGRCIILDTDRWNTLMEFEAHVGSIMSIAVNPNQTTFATCGTDRVIHIWNLADTRLTATLNGHTASVNSVAWSPTGEQLVSASTDAKIKIWNVFESLTYRQYPINFGRPSTLRWEPSGSRLHFTSQSGITGVVEIKTGRVEKLTDRPWRISHRTSPIESEIIENLLQAEQKNVVKPTQFEFYHPNEEEKGEELTHGNPDYYGFSWTRDGKRIAIFRKFRMNTAPSFSELYTQIEVWNALTQQQESQWRISTAASSQWAPDNRRLAVAGAGQRKDGGGPMFAGWVYVFDCETGKTIHKLQHGIERTLASAIAWNPTGTRMISGNHAGLACIWDTNTGKLLASEDIQRTGILSLAWSPDHKRIASASQDGQVKIIDPETCEEILSVKEVGNTVSQLAWSPDGRELAGIDSDGVIVAWDATRGFESLEGVENLRNKQYETFDHARQLVREKDFDKALILIDELASHDFSSMVELYMLRGGIYLARNEIESALAAHTRIVELSPSHMPVWILKISDELRLGKWDDAIRTCTELIESGTAGKHFKGLAYANRGIAFKQLGKHDSALADSLKSVEMVPTFPMPHNNLAWLLVTGREPTNSDLEQGVQHARRAVELGPNDAQNWNTLGVALYYSDQWQEAIDSLQKAIELNTVSKSNQSSLDDIFLAMAHWQLNHKEEARKWYDQAVESMEENKSQDKELLRFRDEATKLLNIVPKSENSESATPQGK